MKKVIAVVPVKKNSSRVANKNFLDFYNGNSLLKICLDMLSQSTLIDEICVYTSEPIESIHLGNNFASIVLRDKSFDSDETQMNEILYSFAQDVFADVYVLVHVTSPFLNITTIEKGIKGIINDQYDSAFTVREFRGFMWDENNLPSYKLDAIPRTQDIPPKFIETSGYYAFNREVIIDSKSRIGKNPMLLNLGVLESIDIDNQEDLIIAKLLYGAQKKK
jgi:CMP-N-acetylneuraminic acid synthetase